MPQPANLDPNVAIPPKYLQPASSGVQLEVVNGENVLDVVIP
jgi:hypothetical protein